MKGVKTPAQLEKEANLLLYGTVSEPARTRAAQYYFPRNRAGDKCEGCSKPRSKLSARFCRACYRREAWSRRTRNDTPVDVNMNFGYEGEAGHRVPSVDK